MSEDKWLIQDTRQCVGNCAMWWRANGKGYTCDLDDAGIYTKEEASKIENNRKTDKAVPLKEAEKHQVRHVRVDTNGGLFSLRRDMPWEQHRMKMQAAREKRFRD